MRKLEARELEEFERRYFEFILTALKENIKDVLEGLHSRLRIKADWYERFKKTARAGYEASDLERGAERIFFWIYDKVLRHPNSAPIGADMLYETADAFLHIDIKTSVITNKADYRGLVNIGQNQTSFKTPSIHFEPNLPTYYSAMFTHPEKGEKFNKPCLTYLIHIIHKQYDEPIYAILLISVPNGELEPIYRDERIVNAGKSGRGRDIRYAYWRCPYFKLLSNNSYYKYRVEFVYLLELENVGQREITRIDPKKHRLPVHFLVKGDL
ncbi:hypothetical protein H5T87_09325 [bacterium]|nr:hypothetical protein [bacterium]